MKRLIGIMISLSVITSIIARDFKNYGVEREYPIYMEEMVSELTYPLAWGNSDITDFTQWRAEARKALEGAMMIPPPHPGDFNAEVIYEEQRDGYKAQIVQLDQSGYMRVNVYLLIPDGNGPFPGVVLFHDHGGHFLIGKEKMIKPINSDSIINEDADKWAEQCYGGQYVGDNLAKNGYAVICGDALFWGERGRKEGVNKQKLGDFAGNLLGMGRCMSGMTTFEDAYLAEYFASLPFVDADRLGCMGFSIGAYRAWMLSAYTDIVKAAACVCWMTTTDYQFGWEYGKEHGGYANTLPTIRYYMDHPHVASIACPKPMLMINGDSDKLFPVPAVEKAFGIMRDTWESQGVGERLTTMILPMPHYCGPEVQVHVVDFFDKWFK